MRRIEFQRFIKREDLRNNPHKRYLFGDNVRKYGMGGQAAEMRGEFNAVGIPTKWSPSNDLSSFFVRGRDDIDGIKRLIDDAFDSIPDDVIVVVPVNGIGTGLAHLTTLYPEVLEYIEYKIKELGCQ